jgi:hypothetical protein
MSDGISYPTRDGYSETVYPLYAVYQSEVLEGGITIERIVNIFECESAALDRAREIGERVRILEILRLPEVTVR